MQQDEQAIRDVIESWHQRSRQGDVDGVLRVAMTMPDGKAVRREGYALSILTKRKDGRWLVARDANMLGPPT